MEIYIVQPNDTLYSIATRFNVTTRKIIQDNQLTNPNNLIPGQTIVIVYPEQTHIARDGDTLESIANEYTVTQMQLLRNNPFLSNTTVKPGDILTIRYDTTGTMRTNGYIYPYVDRNIYIKTLPNLTYITIYNYRITAEGEIISYFDDTPVIQLAKDYGTIPLFMATTLSAQGEPDVDAVFSLLSNNTYLENFIDNSISIMKQKGYLGLNVIFNYINTTSLDLYLNVILKLKDALDQNNFLFFVTINPNTSYVNNELVLDKIDYSPLSDYVNNIRFVQFIWGINYGPPLPVNSIARLRPFIEYVTSIIPSDKISIGNSLISYDWALPYVPGVSYANSLSINSALRLASDVGTVIQFDEASQTPYFTYVSNSTEHIVWSVDARSIEALISLIREYNLEGIGFWNLMIYIAQLWLVINAQYDIIKLIPSKFD